MKQDIFYSRKTNKAVQVIAECEILPEGTEAVCYQELTGTYSFYVKRKEQFQTEYHQIESRVGGGGEAVRPDPKPETAKEETKGQPAKEEPAKEEQSKAAGKNENPAMERLLRFLDADTYGEKIKILEGMKDELDDHLLNNIAVSLDLSLEDGVDGYAFLMSELRIRSRYEGKRGVRL